MSPRRARRPRRQKLNWTQAQEYLLKSRYQYSMSADRCAEVARELLQRRIEMDTTAVREIALELLDSIALSGYPLPLELVELLRRELAIKPSGVSSKPEYRKALAVAKANPGISVRALAEQVSVPWPTVGRWMRQPYWKLSVSMK
jgi:hypothetical protein